MPEIIEITVHVEGKVNMPIQYENSTLGVFLKGTLAEGESVEEATEKLLTAARRGVAQQIKAAVLTQVALIDINRKTAEEYYAHVRRVSGYVYLRVNAPDMADDVIAASVQLWDAYQAAEAAKNPF